VGLTFPPDPPAGSIRGGGRTVDGGRGPGAAGVSQDRRGEQGWSLRLVRAVRPKGGVVNRQQALRAASYGGPDAVMC
jgi:hypothetical protein